MLVLHRLVPPRGCAGAGGPARSAPALARVRRAPHARSRDGLPVTYVPYVSPPRERSYASWGAWAAPPLALALRRLRAHVPVRADPRPQRRARRRRRRAARARARRWSSRSTAATCSTPRCDDRAGARAVARGLGAAELVLANSHGIAELAQRRGRRRDAGGAPRRRPAGGRAAPGAARGSADAGDGRAIWSPASATPTCCARWRCSRPRHPTLRYSIIGDGPERTALEGLAARLGVAERVDFHGQLEPAEALDAARRARCS